MGYELHISRRKHWADDRVPSDITLEEWMEYANHDPELELTGTYGPAFYEWKEHPTHKEPGKRPWFSYADGMIDSKNPDSAAIRKMLRIATALNANVQGDDGELYDEESIKELEILEKASAQLKPKSKWKLW